MARKKKAAKKTAAVETPPDEVEALFDDTEPDVEDPFDDPEPEAPAEKAPAAPPEPGPMTAVEKAAAEKGEKASRHEDWSKRQRIVDALEADGKTVEDVASADYYEMRGVTVLTLKDGRKVDVSD